MIMRPAGATDVLLLLILLGLTDVMTQCDMTLWPA
jgi:hypothetical protein